MKALYDQFVNKIKAEEIRQYNLKHKDYLIRVGKMMPEGEAAPVRNKRKREFQNAGKPKPIEQPDQRSLKVQATPIYEERKRHQPSIDVSEIPIKNIIQVQNTSQPTQKTKRIEKRIIQQERNEHIQSEDRPLQGKITNQNIEEYAEVQLVACPIGCGRKFKPEAIQKHSKVCKKVFQEKRKPFEVKMTPEEAEGMKNKTGASSPQKKPSKWKKESEKFRNMLKMGRGDKNEGPQQQQIDDRIPCPYCNRKFNETAAQRHIAICKKKSENIGRRK